MSASILVIDDDKDLADYVAAGLTEAGHTVNIVGDGAAARAFLADATPDLLLLDLTLADVDGHTLMQEIRSTPGTTNVSIVLLTTESTVADLVRGLDGGADDYLSKPFDLEELVARVGSVLRRVRSMRDLSPLTGLPGNFRIADELQRRVAAGGPLAVVHGDFDNFKAFNDHYGFMRGDKVIRFIAEVLVEAARTTGDPTVFIGHVGGDDFVMAMNPTVAEQFCKEVIERFDDGVLDFYDPADALRGYVEVLDRRGERHAFPIVSFSLGIATNERRSFSNEWEMSAVASEMCKAAKSDPGSSYRIDRRTS
ncbi:MAG: response regulator [Acidimicrobiia bacterium]